MNNELTDFVEAFTKTLNRTPEEFIKGKIANGSPLNAIESEFNILAATISKQSEVEFFDFDAFYPNITL